MKLPTKRDRRRNRRRIAFDPANTLQLLRLRNRHYNEQCIVIAPGPSLGMIDLSLIADHPNVIGVNGVYKIHNQLRYYFVSSPNFYLSNEKEISKVKAERTFLSSHIPFLPGPSRTYLKLHEKRENIIYHRQYFHANLLKSLFRGPTVILDIVLPTLIWMGFSEIILVGADYSLENFKRFYPENEHKVIKFVDNGNEMIDAHQSFHFVKQFIEKNNNLPKIIDASPCSDLDCFPKIALEDAVKITSHD
jgi:hypothetical protein